MRVLLKNKYYRVNNRNTKHESTPYTQNDGENERRIKETIWIAQGKTVI